MIPFKPEYYMFEKEMTVFAIKKVIFIVYDPTTSNLF